jgi:hypothetical protein
VRTSRASAGRDAAVTDAALHDAAAAHHLEAAAHDVDPAAHDFVAAAHDVDTATHDVFAAADLDTATHDVFAAAADLDAADDDVFTARDASSDAAERTRLGPVTRRRRRGRCWLAVRVAAAPARLAALRAPAAVVCLKRTERGRRSFRRPATAA